MRIVAVVCFQDEEELLPGVLESLEKQERPPDRVILSDDGSEDGSAALADAWAAERPTWSVVHHKRRPPEKDRLGTGSEIKGFNRTVAEHLGPDWDVVAKIDADLVFPPSSIATLEAALEADPGLGVAGFFLSEPQPDGSIARWRTREEHVNGATKFYRRECWEQTGPPPEMLGWELIDMERARRLGWRTRSVTTPDGDVMHLRPMGTRDGSFRGWRRHGAAGWSMGEHPLHAVGYAVLRLPDPPRVVGSIAYLLGQAEAAARRRPRAEPELRAYVRHHQMRRVRERLRLSSRAASSETAGDHPSA